MNKWYIESSISEYYDDINFVKIKKFIIFLLVFLILDFFIGFCNVMFKMREFCGEIDFENFVYG